jgi:hypothetical protein
VLSLLVLFVVLAVTFTIVASQYDRAARSESKREWFGVPPSRHLEGAMYQLLRDTTWSGSALRFQSLLRDYYGEDGFRGKIADATALQLFNTTNPPWPVTQTLSGGEFFDLPLNTTLIYPPANPNATPPVASTTAFVTVDGQSYTISQYPGFYNGCMFTITSGKAAGLTTPVVGYFYVTNNVVQNQPVLRVLTCKTLGAGAVTLTDLAGAEFILNGRPFGGTGFGFQCMDENDQPYNPNTSQKAIGKLSKEDVTWANLIRVALLPNHAGRPRVATVFDTPNNPIPMQAEFTALLNGGSNEGYDAVDEQNLFLAMVKPNVLSGRDIVPSFHRPPLINYYMQKYPAFWANDNFKRYVCLRPVEPSPVSGGNPIFTGSNPSFDYVYGPWDVDNDGDGIPDSIWVDLGFPVQTMPDGRRYKPLFAILCTDLDGRLNVNVHGRLAGTGYVTTPANVALGTTSGFPKTMGLGPPDVDLSGVSSGTNLTNLLKGRYGADQVPGASGYELLTAVKFFEEPENYFTGVGGLSSYFSPCDLRGELAFGLDWFGQPAFDQLPNTVTNTRADCPYELNLVDRKRWDTPYTPAELERVLRSRDVDVALLPNRLAASLDLSAAANARLVTTDSYDPPLPGITAPGELRAKFGNAHARNVMELMGAKLDTTNPNLNTVAKINQELTKLLSPDLALGLRMDINRPLGNGRDTGGGLVDEIGEQAEYVWNNATGTYPSPFQLQEGQQFRDIPFYHTNGLGMGRNATGINVDVNNDGKVDYFDHVMARQLLARHLYVLMLSLIDYGSGAPPTNVAKQVAQWAINVVDFRDADSIMTPFEYDTNPFNGWCVDGNIATDESQDDGIDNDGDAQTDESDEKERDVVWGCERPELLITEVLAWHDRRTENRDDDDGSDTPRKYDPNDPNSDRDFDQRLRPRGAFFVELFNPWTSATTVRPQELYTSNNLGVDLSKVATKGTTKSPVWRLRFKRQNGNDTRHIYFVNPSAPGGTWKPAINTNSNNNTVDYGTSLAVAPIQPGRYAVVGSSGIVYDDNSGNGNEYYSPMGRRAGLTEADETDFTSLQVATTRGVKLSPNANGNQVHLINNGKPAATAGQSPPTYGDATPANDQTGQPKDQDIWPATAVVIDIPRSLSVSEPLDGYTAANFQDPNASATLEGKYMPPRDDPLDTDSALLNDQTTTWGTVYVERLADPTAIYDKDTNPYRTIDAMRCDLTSFNGATSETDPKNTAQTVYFYAVQRGDQKPQRQLWCQEPSSSNISSDSEKDASGSHYFNYYARTTLGCLNHGYWPYQDSSNGYPGAPWVNQQYSRVFASLAWNNRPFISQYELLQVPHKAMDKLLEDFGLPSGANPYDADDGPYKHLLNFFQVSGGSGTPPHFYRILDYVHVPSRFVGTDVELNPQYFGINQFSGIGIVDITRNWIVNPRLPDPTSATFYGQTQNPSFLPPFNRVSRFRDPGRVNINTIYDRKVWDALLGGYPGPSFDDLVKSRRGYDPNSIDIIPPNPDVSYPTYVANPFRPAGCGTLTPLSHLERKDIETTLLRSTAVAPTTPPPPPPPQPPLPPPTPPAPQTPMIQGGTFAANSTATDVRNSLFCYNDLQRLGNLVTTRSNVYAVWITVGYFEVEPNSIQQPNNQYQVIYDDFHPEGLRLAQEIGAETGEIKRHRAFYIIDRTIPVAFQPGENHNVDRCVLLRRYIE